MSNSVLTNIRKLFQYYRKLGDRSFDQLTESQLLQQPNEVSNSIAVIVKHLRGNMLSRWTDFLNSDGEKTWRNRDDEFEDTLNTKEAVITAWNEGWDCLFQALDSIEDQDLERIVYIRNEGHTVLEAIHRQLAHYAYHIGQIVYLARMLKGNDWTSLSIPKGGSKIYNANKFNADKADRHFTDQV
jgi:uncharacterized damage-inducible protein DinB